MQSTNVNSLEASTRANAEFQQSAAGDNYTLQAFGIQAGQSCSPMLMFNNAKGASIQVTFSADDAISQVVYSPPSTVTHYVCTPSCAIWSGEESYRCQVSGSQCNAVAMSSAQGVFNVPPATVPTLHEDSSCCVTSNWVGIGDAQGASDGTLFQGGVDVNSAHETSESCNSGGSCFGTPAFWYECLGCTSSASVYWNSNCLTVNYGDDVNVTASRGSFVSGGTTYTAKLTYSDNDSSSTCAVIWFFKGTGTTFNAYWAYYILESVTYSGCSYSTGGFSNLCQISEFNNNPVVYTAENYYSAGGWAGFESAPSGYLYSEIPHYLYQGIQDTTNTINSVTQFTEAWQTSQQI